MGAGDKASNKVDDLGGKAKEGLGKVTGDKSTENQGKVDQAKSSLKDAGEDQRRVQEVDPYNSQPVTQRGWQADCCHGGGGGI